MNAELRGLLAAAGYTRALEAGEWASAIVYKNFGAVPPPPDLPPESAQRDFKLLLLDGKGRATHLAHVGASADPLLEREASILATLSAQAALSRTVPFTRTVCSERLRLLLTTYLPGRAYATIMRRQGADAWGRAVSEILQVSEAVTRCAEEVLPALLEGGDQVSVAEAAAPRLQILGDAGFPAPHIDILRRSFESVPPLRRRIQHGDLWPANVLRHAGSWWLIDFAEFGHAQVPLYDAFLLVHHSWLMRGPGAAAQDWVGASRRVVTEAAGRLALSAQEVGAAMAYYLVHLSAYRLRHGVWRRIRAHFLRDLSRVAEGLEAGAPLAALPFPWESPA